MEKQSRTEGFVASILFSCFKDDRPTEFVLSETVTVSQLAQTISTSTINSIIGTR